MTLISELSPRAREILLSGCALNRPSNADRERVQSALQTRLNPGLALAPPSPASAPRSRWPFITGAFVGAGWFGGAVLFAARPPPAARRPPRASAAASAAASSKPPSAPNLEAPLAVAATPAALLSSARPPATARPADDRSALEVALLARATGHLHAGRASDELEVLDEYQLRFPRGLLREERRAAGPSPVCARSPERRPSGARSPRLAPQSLAAARARQVCETRAALDK